MVHMVPVRNVSLDAAPGSVLLWVIAGVDICFLKSPSRLRGVQSQWKRASLRHPVIGAADALRVSETFGAGEALAFSRKYAGPHALLAVHNSDRSLSQSVRTRRQEQLCCRPKHYHWREVCSITPRRLMWERPWSRRHSEPNYASTSVDPNSDTIVASYRTTLSLTPSSTFQQDSISKPVLVSDSLLVTVLFKLSGTTALDRTPSWPSSCLGSLLLQFLGMSVDPTNA